MKKLLRFFTINILILIAVLFSISSVDAKVVKKTTTTKKVYSAKINHVEILATRYKTVLNAQMKNKVSKIALSSNGYNVAITDSALKKALNETSSINNVDRVYITKVFVKKRFIGYTLKIQYKRQTTAQNNVNSNNVQAIYETETYKKSLDFFLLDKHKEDINKLSYEIAKAIFDARTFIYIPKELYLGDIKKLTEAVEDVLFSYSDFGYLRRIGYTVDTKGATLTFGYSLSQDEILKMNVGLYDVVKNTASKIEAQINSSNTLEEKIKIIHDYIAYNFNYDVDFLKTNDEAQYARDSHAYYALTTNKAICGGYSSAFQRLTKYFGIESLIVIGTADGDAHAWNKVKVGDMWLHVDVTFDDPVVYGYPNRNMVRYDYFLKTDEEMARTHTWN